MNRPREEIAHEIELRRPRERAAAAQHCQGLLCGTPLQREVARPRRLCRPGGHASLRSRHRAQGPGKAPEWVTVHQKRPSQACCVAR